MSTETVDIIVKCCTGALSVILGVFTIINGIKSGKWKKLFNNENTQRNCIYVLLEIMQEAESFMNYTAEEKKQYVMTKFNQYCIDNNFLYDKELTDTNIETLIDFSKSVNSEEKNGSRQEHKL